MKRSILLIVSIMVISTSLHAQRMNTIKTDLFSPVIRTYAIKYERAFTKDVSFQLGLFYTGFHPRDSETTLSGYGITPEFRFYLSDTPAPHGTYLAPNIRYMSLTVTDPIANEEGTLTNLNFAINLGKQVLFKDIVLIDAWVGPSYNFRSLDDPSGNIEVGRAEVNGFGLRLGIAIGLAF
ncbi:MAG: DUF3575 domain-containing protein [Bacteroidota bacterium]